MSSERKEAELLQKKYYGKPEELAVHLSRICLTKPGVVYQVFLILDPYSTLDVGGRFVYRTSEAVLHKLAVTYDGYILCSALFSWFSNIRLDALPPGFDNVRQQDEYKVRLQIVLTTQKERRNDSDRPRQLSQTEMDYYAAYNQTDAVMWENVNKVYVANGGRRNDFDPTVCWQLPRNGTGFVVYNQNDLHKDYPMAKRANFKDDYGYDQIGTKETIEAMIHIAREWANLNTGRELQYGDISRPGGINTPDHKTHNNGRAFDIRPLRKDSLTGKEGNLTYTMTGVYDQNLTKKFILLVVGLYPGTTFYFNDPQLDGVDKETKNLVRSMGGHNDHLHVMFPGGN